MAASNGNTSLIFQGKRKRTVVSYAEVHDDLGDEFKNLAPSENDEIGGTDEEAARKPKRKKMGGKKAQPTKHSYFDFLALPPEIRNVIYELALTGPQGVLLGPVTKNHRQVVGRVYPRTAEPVFRSRGLSQDFCDSITHKVDLVPNLLAVNRQVHAEAAGYLYQQRLHFLDSRALYAFASTIGQQALEHLRKVAVYKWNKPTADNAAMTALAPATSLLSFWIVADLRPRYTMPDHKLAKKVALKLWRDMHFFIKAYGRAAGCEAAALPVIELAGKNFERVLAAEEDETDEEKEMIGDQLGWLYMDNLRKLVRDG